MGFSAAEMGDYVPPVPPFEPWPSATFPRSRSSSAPSRASSPAEVPAAQAAKGVVSERGLRKRAFYVLQAFYEELAGRRTSHVEAR